MDLRIALNGIALVGCAIGAANAGATSPNAAPDLPQVKRHLATLSMPFVPNAGQWNSRAAFAAHTFAGTLFVTSDGQLVYSLPGKEIDKPGTDLAVNWPEDGRRGLNTPRHHAHRERTPGVVLTETLIDSEGHALALTPRGDDSRLAKVS